MELFLGLFGWLLYDLGLDGLEPGLLGYGNNVDMVYDMCKEQRNVCSLLYHTTNLETHTDQIRL